MSNACITVVGIGNRTMGDDGIALSLLDTIKDELPAEIDIQFWENKDALSITAELMAIQMPVVIVDCADMGLSGGEYRWFKETECYLEKHSHSLSTHGVGFADALALAQTLGFMQSLFFFTVQPVKLDCSLELSITLQNKKPSMADSLLQHLLQFKQELMSPITSEEN